MVTSGWGEAFKLRVGEGVRFKHEGKGVIIVDATEMRTVP